MREESDVPTGGLRRCEFSSSHLGKLIGGESIMRTGPLALKLWFLVSARRFTIDL